MTKKRKSAKNKSIQVKTIPNNNSLREIKVLIFSIGICLVAGAIGSVFTMQYIPTWYAYLAKPEFAPPNWIFGPVWTSLYILMGISLYSVLVKEKNLLNLKNKLAVMLFSLQLGLNMLWSFLFFSMQSPFLGLIGIIGLWLSILATMLEFHKVSKRASYLLFPYLIWVTFATLLNLSIYLLNP